MLFKRMMGLLALVFGFVGVVACLAGMYGVWVVGSRLEQANDKVFAALDKGLASTQDLVRRVQKRVNESKITLTEIDQHVSDWTKSKVKDRLVLQLGIESRAEKVAGHLQTADSGLETATAAIQGLQQVLQLVNLAGAPADKASLENVLEKITALRSTLQQVDRAVEDIRAFAVSKDDTEENRLLRVTKLLARAVVTVVDVNTGLEDAVVRLSELRADTQQVKARVSNYILWAMIGCFCILAWIAAGQIALCVCGWRGCWRRGQAA